MIQGLIDGILIGGVFSILAVGLTLLFGVVGVVNFAHGAVVMSSSYLALVLHREVGLDPYLSVIPLAALYFVIGVAFHRFLLSRLDGKSLVAQALFTLGISMVLANGALAIFGPDLQTLRLSYSLSTVSIGSISLEVTRLVAFGAALVATALLAFLLWRTDFGIQVRAAAADGDTARLMGIRASRVQSVATGLSLACAGLAGAVLLPILYVSPASGNQFIFLAFIIIVLGGLGSFWGALVGGIIIGVTQSLGTTYFDGSWAQLLTFVIFVLILLLKPSGLFARSAA